MKTIIIITAALFLSILTSTAENCRYVTVTSTNTAYPGVVQVLQGETAEIMVHHGDNTFAPRPVHVEKNGVILTGFPLGYVQAGNSGLTRGTIVAGPATIRTYDTGNPVYPAVLTVKVTPDAYDVNKTLILPPGTNQVYIALESSTNLLNWADASNGVYGSPDVARFFRIRMQNLPAP